MGNGIGMTNYAFYYTTPTRTALETRRVPHWLQTNGLNIKNINLTILSTFSGQNKHNQICPCGRFRDNEGEGAWNREKHSDRKSQMYRKCVRERAWRNERRGRTRIGKRRVERRGGRREDREEGRRRRERKNWKEQRAAKAMIDSANGNDRQRKRQW